MDTRPAGRRRLLASVQSDGCAEHRSGQAAGAQTVGARLWRLAPGQASTRHRHRDTHELYVLLEGTGRIRIGEQLVTLTPLGSVLVEPDQIRQVFNDSDSDQLWLIVGAPTEAASTLQMTPDTLAFIYPDGPKALPPEIGGGTYEGP